MTRRGDPWTAGERLGSAWGHLADARLQNVVPTAPDGRQGSRDGDNGGEFEAMDPGRLSPCLRIERLGGASSIDAPAGPRAYGKLPL